jgi:hypothetical protein
MFIEIFSDGCNGFKRGQIIEGNIPPSKEFVQTSRCVWTSRDGDVLLILLDGSETLTSLEAYGKDVSDGED